MTKEAETLTDLVAERVGEGRGMTYRQFEERAVDRKTGRRPSRDVLWKISKGKPVKVDPAIVGAVAAGLGLPENRVRAAAAYQYTGLIATEVAGGIVLHEPSAEADTDATRKAVGEQQAREADE